MSEVVQKAAEMPGDLRPQRRWGYWIVAGVLLTVSAVAIPVGLARYDSWRVQRSKDFARNCRKLRQAQDWQQLAAVADEWRAWDTHNADAILFRAEAAQGTSDFPLAADLLHLVPAKSPKRLAALIERTTLLFGPLNQPLEGVRACREVLELEPRAFAIHQRLIQFYAFTLQQEELLRQIYQAIELGCEPVEAYVYLMLADVLTFQNGFEVTNRWLAPDTTQETFLVARTIHLWKHLSMEASPSDDTKEKLRLAEQFLHEYLEKYPQNLAVLTFFANLGLNNGDVEQVGQLLRRFPDAGHQDGRYWRFKGWLHAALDEYEQAETAYRESLRIYPFSWSVRHELADIVRRKRDFPQVARLQELALSGKELRQQLMEIPDARSVPNPLLVRIRDYARRCGDDFVADALAKRLSQLHQD
jgi:tetratricopeptide (TPR) repeat protein